MKKLFPKTEFAKDTFTLMAGTMLAQLLPIAISPALSRLYTPADMAAIGLYMSLVNILLPLATGSYEFAIMLPQKKEETINMFVGVLMIAFTMCSLFFFVVFFFDEQLLTLFKIKSLSPWLIFVPLSVFIIAAGTSFTYFYNKYKEYKIIAINKVNKNWSMSLTQLALGYTKFQSIGLLSGQILGDLLSTLLLLFHFIRMKNLAFLRTHFSFPLVKKLMVEYKKFPVFTMPTVLMNNMSTEILTVLIALWFNDSLTGAYYFTMRILSAPMALIGSAFAQTFFQKFTEIIQEGKHDPKPFLIKIWWKLFSIAVVPLAVLFVWGEDLFVLVFGADWVEAGKIASIVAPMTLFTFISSPTSSTFMVLQKQKYNLYFGIFVFTFRPLSFFIGYYFNDFILGLKILVAFEILNVILYNALMWYFLKNPSAKTRE